MQRVLLTIVASLIATTFTPLAAMAQSRAESTPDGCEMFQGEPTGYFVGAEDGNTVISVFRDSIHSYGPKGSVNFDYMTSRRRVRNQAQVNCHESLDHWHRFLDEYRAELVDVSSYASHRMLNYVCERAGHAVGEQTTR